MAVKSTRAVSKRMAMAFGNDAAMIVVVLFLTLCCCLLTTADAASVHKRSPIDSTTVSADNSKSVINAICAENRECGWAVYVPFTRTISSYIKNTCDCDPSMACLRTEDNLSSHSYTFRCKPRLPTTNSAEAMSQAP